MREPATRLRLSLSAPPPESGGNMLPHAPAPTPADAPRCVSIGCAPRGGTASVFTTGGAGPCRTRGPGHRVGARLSRGAPGPRRTSARRRSAPRLRVFCAFHSILRRAHAHHAWPVALLPCGGGAGWGLAICGLCATAAHVPRRVRRTGPRARERER